MRQGSGSRDQGTGKVVAGLAALALLGGGLVAQDLGGASAATKKGHVSLLSDSADVAAGKPEVVELRFKVDEGYHVNSHKPKDDLLIPTTLKVDDNAAVKVVGEEYPAGHAYSFPHGDGSTLDVYEGEFRVRVKVVAARGAQTLTGALRYQACDSAACYPPRTLPVMVAINGK